MLEKLAQSVEELKKVADAGETITNGFIIATPTSVCMVGSAPTIMTLLSQTMESFVENFNKNGINGIEALDEMVKRVKENCEKK